MAKNKKKKKGTGRQPNDQPKKKKEEPKARNESRNRDLIRRLAMKRCLDKTRPASCAAAVKVHVYHAVSDYRWFLHYRA